MIKPKKTTVTKFMSVRDYLCVCWVFENLEAYNMGEMVDLSDCDENELAKSQKFKFRLTKEQKEIFDGFFGKFVTGRSFASILDTIKKKGSHPGPVTHTNTKKCINAPVLDDDTRLMLEQLDRQPQQKAGSFADYPFILDPNDDLSADNIDLPMMLRMVEQGKVSVDELQNLVGVKYNKIFSLSPASFKNVEGDYADEDSVANCLIEAKRRWELYQEVKDEPEPDKKDTLERFYQYLKNNLVLANAKDIENMETFMDRIIDVNNDTIYFCSDDGDEQINDSVHYPNSEALQNDLIKICDRFNFSRDKSIDIFGVKNTINKIVAKYYKQ